MREESVETSYFKTYMLGLFEYVQGKLCWHEDAQIWMHLTVVPFVHFLSFFCMSASTWH